MQTAEAMFQHVFRNFGLPKDIVSDRGPKFTSRVWGSLCAQLGIGISLSSGYHPQSNGQAEWLNQEIGRFLRSYCSREQQRWREPSDVPAMEEWSRLSQEVWERAHVCLQRVVRRQKIQVNRRRHPHPPGTCDSSCPAASSAPSLWGHLRSIHQVNPVSYRLWLPVSYRICPTFQISLLKPAHPLGSGEMGCVEPPPPLDIEGSPGH
ncbi:hypothetical protein QTP70_013818 [Hemibagrus guttatus]|uniref:Integrase catalytic domain-containing protein n=1 Tax=Hemibagrus guttatus TaxID=175788 RepID=A0AAE0RDY5_9TELE|nr:hypothetical protein QTP70_013818 [Hemibagrus guttatus]